jgi:hypothetical protein
VARAADSLLALPAIVLANLCVCYVMTNQARRGGGGPRGAS